MLKRFLQIIAFPKDSHKHPGKATERMDSIIETQRQTHEEIERYEQALSDVLMQNPTVVSRSTHFHLHLANQAAATKCYPKR